MRAVFLTLTAIAALGAASVARAETFTCPAVLETDTTPAGHPQSFKFRYVSFCDGDPSELADLAPEEDLAKAGHLNQRWEIVRNPGRPIVVVCRYHGTEATIRKNLPPGIKECRLEGLIDAKGEIQGSPKLECK